MIIAALILICGNFATCTKQCQCDLIEFNTVESDFLQSPFHQVIFWRWNHEYCRYDARAWVSADDVVQIDQRRVKVRGWIVSGPIRFTLTDHDPERLNRNLCPDGERRPMPWEPARKPY